MGARLSILCIPGRNSATECLTRGIVVHGSCCIRNEVRRVCKENTEMHITGLLQLFAETMSFGLRLRERAIDAIKSKISEIQCWLEARLQEFTVLVKRRERTCHITGPSTACVASTKSIWQELREIWPNNVQHPGRSQQCSRCSFDLSRYVLDTEPSPAQLPTIVFYSQSYMPQKRLRS